MILFFGDQISPNASYVYTRVPQAAVVPSGASMLPRVLTGGPSGAQGHDQAVTGRQSAAEVDGQHRH